MTENKKKETTLNNFVVNGQYVKDLSFENPNAPKALFENKEKPKIDISVDLKAQKLADKVFELSLNIHSKASVGEDTVLFIIELSYAGVFTINDQLDEDTRKRVLLIDCANILFPFARNIIADTTRDGGYPPLLLEPVNFLAIYEKQGAEAVKGDEKKDA